MDKLTRLLSDGIMLSVLFVTSLGYAQQKGGAHTRIVDIDSVKWQSANVGPSGAMVATLWGDMSKGVYSALVKLPAGSINPLHTHSNEIKVVVISGTFVYGEEGGIERRLGPGSFVSVPPGRKHSTGSTKDSPCIFLQEGMEKFDLKPVEKK